MNDDIQTAIYVWQLGQVMKYQHENGDLSSTLSEPEWSDLVRYFRLGNLPNPDETDAAVDILAIHRRQVEAADPDIRDRVGLLVARIAEHADDDDSERT